MPEGRGYGPDQMNFGASPYAYADEAAEASAAPAPVPATADPAELDLQQRLSQLAPQEIALLDQAITPEIYAILAKLSPRFVRVFQPFAVNDADSPENAMMAMQQQEAQQPAQPMPGPSASPAPAGPGGGGGGQPPPRRPNPLSNIRAA